MIRIGSSGESDQELEEEPCPNDDLEFMEFGNRVWYDSDNEDDVNAME